MRIRTLLGASVAFALVGAACSSSPAATTTTAMTTSTLAIPERAATTTTLDPGAADADDADRLTVAIGELAAEVEVLRALPFVVSPEVLVLDPMVYEERLTAYHENVLETSGPAGKTPYYRLAGLLQFETVERVMERVPVPATLVYYDRAAHRLVVSAAADEADPVFRAHAVHELVLALADQHHFTTDTRSALVAEGADDRLQAFDALVAGDATYFQLVYVQSLPAEDQVAVAAAFAATDSAAVEQLPDFLRSGLAFPYDAGTTFVEDLIVGAGIAGVDQAYREPPDSTEHIVHPERYRRGEVTAVVAPVEVTVEGATTTPSAAFGELQLDHLLSLSLDPGVVTQAVDGWRGDQYQIVESNGGAAFGLSLRMLTGDDAIEVVAGLVAHAREVLEAGDGIEAEGGILWEGGSRYVFIDRIGDGLIYVLASDSALGSEVRSQLRVP